MIRKHFLVLPLMFVLQICAMRAMAQAEDPPKREIAAEFSVLTRQDFVDGQVLGELGLGGRFTYNLNKNVALEGAGYFFPRRCFNCPSNGRIVEAVGGVKAGKRFDKWGLFAKARPGIVSFTEGTFDILPGGTGTSFPFLFKTNWQTNFAADVGAVLEFYPTRRIVTRFDAGDTIIHFNEQVRNGVGFDPATNSFFLFPFKVPGRTDHNLQLSASIGFRW